jgi:hypothetical protein
MAQELEAFVTESGEVTSVWDVTFSEPTHQEETQPCSYPQADGGFREGTITFTLELSQVGFLSSLGAFRVGSKGQLSTPEDSFYQVTVLSVEEVGDHDRVVGEARKRSNPRFDRPESEA